MQTLKKKMFWTLYGIFSLMTVLVLGFNGTQAITGVRQGIYSDLVLASRRMEEYAQGVDSEMFKEFKDSQQPDDLEIISSCPVYTFMLSRNSSLFKVLYFNADEPQLEQASLQAREILETCRAGSYSEGSIFNGQFAWYYASPRTLTLMDVSGLYKGLMTTVMIYVLALIFFEIAFFFICRMVVSWMIEPVETAFEKQKQFIADASHELKTPLAVISANAEEMKISPDQKWLDNILEESRKMNRLVNDLLSLTRTEQQEIQFERINFSKLAEKEFAMQEVRAFEKGKTMDSEIEEKIMADAQPDQIMQVFGILLDNAIEHADSKIKVRTFLSGNKAVYEVENDGPSIPLDQQDRIFERFYRGDKSRNRNSSRYGLGLAIARNIASNHGGTLEVYSQNGTTVFTFKIPLNQKSKDESTDCPFRIKSKIIHLWNQKKNSSKNSFKS